MRILLCGSQFYIDSAVLLTLNADLSNLRVLRDDEDGDEDNKQGHQKPDAEPTHELLLCLDIFWVAIIAVGPWQLVRF